MANIASQKAPTRGAIASLRRHWVRTLVAAVLLIAAAAAYFSRRHSSVTVLSPRRGPIVEAIYGLGTVRTVHSYQVRLGVAATIEELYVSEGQPVTRNQPLVRFDTVGVFRTPISGVVTSVPFDEKETIFPQQPVVTVEDLSELYIEVSLEQRGALRAQKGQPATLVFESLRNEKFTGRVTSVFPRQDTFIARIDADSLPAEVLPGMTADVAIQVARRENALLIPLKALDRGTVLRKRDGKRAERVEVKVGAIDGSWAEVTGGGVELGDELIVRER